MNQVLEIVLPKLACVVAIIPFASSALVAQVEVPCRYVAAPLKSDATSELEGYPSCAVRDSAGEYRLLPGHLAALDFHDGLASILIDGQWHYVKESGQLLPVLTFDNGPDYWSEGLVRSRRDGKIVYVGRDFQPAFPPRYDWGWPFEDGLALVCLGCKPVDSEGEHREVRGGSWGYIDKLGREVVAVNLSRDEALALDPP